MTLENTFYVLGIIFMVLNIAILVGIVVGVFFIKKKIEEIQQNVEEKIATVKEVTSQPAELARGMGAIVAGLVSFGLKRIIKR
jgi:hypothetical protein